MIEINVISVGNVKEKYLQDLIADYKKRISKYALISLTELKDESNKINENIVKEIEGERILASIKDGFYVVLLDLKGTMLDSVEFSKKIDEISTYYSSKIAFVIGGSFGVSDEVKKRADYKISFSKMTFPHQLAKGILLEQIYRSFKILKNESYHK
jgi:23S rRNA (pseudouridine1915-N3)-methyltransferase